MGGCAQTFLMKLMVYEVGSELKRKALQKKAEDTSGGIKDLVKALSKRKRAKWDRAGNNSG